MKAVFKSEKNDIKREVDDLPNLRNFTAIKN
jgi:hypothetical protein